MDSKRDYMDQGSYLIMSPRSKCLLLTWEILGRRIVPHPPCLWDFGLFQAASCFKRGGCSLGLGLPRVQAYNAKLLEERIGIKGVAVRTSSDWIADRLLKTTSELQAYTMLWEKKAHFGMVFTQVQMWYITCILPFGWPRKLSCFLSHVSIPTSLKLESADHRDAVLMEWKLDQKAMVHHNLWLMRVGVLLGIEHCTHLVSSKLSPRHPWHILSMERGVKTRITLIEVRHCHCLAAWKRVSFFWPLLHRFPSLDFNSTIASVKRMVRAVVKPTSEWLKSGQ